MHWRTPGWLAASVFRGHADIVSALGVCDLCGQTIPLGSSFINVGPTDRRDPDRPKALRFVPVDEDIHGWTPFVVEHPACFAATHGVVAVLQLVDDSHRRLRRQFSD